MHGRYLPERSLPQHWTCNTSLSIQMMEQEKYSEFGSFLQEFSYLLLLLAFTLNKSINNEYTCPHFPFYERSVLVNVLDFIASARTHFWDVKISDYNIANNAIKATLLFKCDNFILSMIFVFSVGISPLVLPPSTILWNNYSSHHLHSFSRQTKTKDTVCTSKIIFEIPSFSRLPTKSYQNWLEK